MCVMAPGLLAKFGVVLPWISATCRIHLCSAAMTNHLPDRWTEYSAVGKRIPGTRFIAFKVPLKKLFDNKLAPQQRFSPTNLISEIEKQNEELGLVVDLTCTKRYYAPQEFPRTVNYAKIFTAGQQVPSHDVIKEFISIVKQFLDENSDNDKLVGVHCTHGLNRTGYLVCRYMINVLGMDPSEAIERFNKSRGHCIERKNYLDDLIQVKRPCANARRPRLSAPAFSQLPGPQNGFFQMGGRPPGFPFGNPGPGIPPPVFSHPHMPGPRHHIPQMEDRQHFRGGPQRYRHHSKRHFVQQQDDRPVRGASTWDQAAHIPQKYGGSMGQYTDTQGSGPRPHGRNGHYRRWPRQGNRGTPEQQ